MVRLSFMCFIVLMNLCSTGIKSSDDLRITGLTQSQVHNRYGAPDADSVFDYYPDKPLYEYQSGLSSIDIKEGDTVKIKELSWMVDSEKLVIWFWKQNNEWVVYDGLQWNPDKIKF